MKNTTRASTPATAALLAMYWCMASGAALADEVVNWNRIAVEEAGAAGKHPPAQSRLFAMVQIAVHDALNSIHRRYEHYAFETDCQPLALPDAAVAAAAHRVLLAELPARQATLDAFYDASLADVPEGAARDRGVALGEAAAAEILALRSQDGSTTPGTYTPGTGPGEWRPTPPGFAPAFLPAWGQVAPFTLVRPSQFRPPPPPALTSRKYRRDFEDVKAMGEVNSPQRTAEQGEIARFWYEGSPAGWNRIARNVLRVHPCDPWCEARLLALVNMSMADAFIAGLEAKYSYNFWRPVTAIREADADGNDDTQADTTWMSFLVTVPTPDYPSTHSSLGAAAAAVMALSFRNDDIPFTTTSGAPFAGITRSFSGFSQAAAENAASRVLAGIHFRFACRAGLRQGERIGRRAFRHFLRPMSPGDRANQ
jgi:hypothetical protein